VRREPLGHSGNMIELHQAGTCRPRNIVRVSNIECHWDEKGPNMLQAI
jgi:hypothetical protein